MKKHYDSNIDLDCIVLWHNIRIGRVYFDQLHPYWIRRLRRFLEASIVALCLPLLPLAYTGCGTTGNLLTTSATPNEKVVINAEKTLSTSKDTLTFFLQQEYQNKAFVKAHLPQVHQFAEYLRGQVSCGPKTTARFTCWLITTNDLKNQYKHGQGNLQALMAAIDGLTQNVTQAQSYLTQINAGQH